MQTITKVSGPGVPLVLDDIDTDRIIPARYLRCVTFDGLGEHAFEDDRKQDVGHPFNDARFRAGTILVAGRNFGCGSSREHAPQALIRWGLKAVIAESFAEIFQGNCTALGVPCVQARREHLVALAAVIEGRPDLPISIDLETKTVRYGETSFPVEIPESARNSLVTGKWDFLAELLEGQESIHQAAGRIPYLNQFAV